MTQAKNSKLEHSSCPIGCVEGDDIVVTAGDLIANMPGSWKVVKCKSCGLMRTNPRVIQNDIAKYYPDNYTPFSGTIIKNGKKRSLFVEVLRKYLQHIFEFNIERIPTNKPGRMLEIGCASGSYMHKMANMGWKVEGVEYSETAARNAKNLGYSVHVGALESAPNYNVKFDLIVGWMVLEHLSDPIGSLKKMRSWAHKDTWLVLSVPNAQSLEFRVFKDRWYALQLPTHYFHYTPASIEKILLKSGWSLEKIHHQRTVNNLIASCGYLLKDYGLEKLGQKLIRFPTQSGSWRYVFYPMALLLSYFGQTGRMTVWAKPIFTKEMK